MAHTQRIPVRFDDVDFARLVFFPKLFGYCHWVFEDFFTRELGISYADMLQGRRVGYPAVQAKADFRAPLRFGDVCRVVMETVRLGERSITCRYRLWLGETETLCAEVEIVTAVISMDDFKSTPLPDDVRAAFAKHLLSLEG